MRAESHARRERDRKARRHDEHMIYSKLEKLRRGCELTGRKLPPEDLEWHHKDPSKKRRRVSHLTTAGHLTFLKELWSCICVGRDVHRQLHGQTVSFNDTVKTENQE